MNIHRQLLIVPLTLFLFSCGSNQSARILDENEADLVDVDSAGAATFDKLVDPTVDKLLEPYKGEFAELKVRRLAFVDLDNRTKEELADWRDHLIDLIEISINKRRAFKAVSVKAISVVLKEMGGPPVEQLVLPSKRREFAKILERDTAPVQYLLYGRLTRGGTKGANTRQADYLLTLELMNIETGESNTVGTKVRKEFSGR
jgi:hypothetical protein